MKILIADDHPSIITAFKAMLGVLNEINPATFYECLSCEATINAIENGLLQNEVIDLALVDYSMPAFVSQDIHSGADVVLYIQKVMPRCKVLLITGAMDSVTVFEVIQNVKPHGFIFKSDLTTDNFPKIIKEVLQGTIYRSESVRQIQQQGWETDMLANKFNRQILRYISLGYKIKEISEQLHLSEAAINKRIAKIKNALNLDDNSGLLREIKKRGYV